LIGEVVSGPPVKSKVLTVEVFAGLSWGRQAVTVVCVPHYSVALKPDTIWQKERCFCWISALAVQL
jgi:hypothetical protein